jgi:acetyltransferase-like isoleucine patch superfamily enzyme
MSQFHKYLKPQFWDRMSTFFYYLKGVDIGKGSFIMMGASILRFPNRVKIKERTILKKNCELCVCNPNAKITVGEDTTIGSFTFIYSSQEIEIGNKCLIAPFVYIVDSNHSIDAGEPIRFQKNTTDKIVIKNDVWIGAHSLILPGVTIGNGAVIAANSVVNTNIADNEIWAGSPAKKLGERK